MIRVLKYMTAGLLAQLVALGAALQWMMSPAPVRDMAVRHARERAALTAWVIECEHYLREIAR